MVLIRKQNIPTELPALVGEVSVRLCLDTALLRLIKMIQKPPYILYTYKLITIVTYNNIKIPLLHK
jgi:hypothetical protein